MRTLLYGGIGGLFSLVLCLLFVSALEGAGGGTELAVFAVVFALPGAVVGCARAVLEEIRALREEIAAAQEQEKEPIVRK